MTIGYIHIRPGQTYSKENGLQGNPDPRGGTTIAYELNEAGTAYYGMAICSPRDSYSRKLGRAVARGRLEKHGCLGSGACIVEEGETAPEAIIGWLNECGAL